MIVAIDPGNQESAWVIYHPTAPLAHRVPEHGKEPNGLVRAHLMGLSRHDCSLVIEMLGHYGTGMPVGKEVFHTAVWIGRFIEAWGDHSSIDLVLRKSYASDLCGSSKAKNGHVRQAVIDRFGGDTEALGNIKCSACNGRGGSGRGAARQACERCQGAGRTPKGPLHELANDEWQALGLAIAYAEGVKVISREEWLGHV